MSSRLFIVVGVLGLIGAASCSSCGSGGGFPADASGPPGPGTVTLAWSLTDTSGAPITCDQVGANSVAITLQGRTTAGTVVSLSCAAGHGTSQALSPDTYDVTIELHGASLTAVPAAAQKGVVVRASADTQLAPAVFAVDPHGAIAFSIRAPQAATNCGAAADKGAGITATTITLQHDAQRAVRAGDVHAHQERHHLGLVHRRLQLADGDRLHRARRGAHGDQGCHRAATPCTSSARSTPPRAGARRYAAGAGAEPHLERHLEPRAPADGLRLPATAPGP